MWFIPASRICTTTFMFIFIEKMFFCLIFKQMFLLNHSKIIWVFVPEWSSFQCYALWLNWLSCSVGVLFDFIYLIGKLCMRQINWLVFVSITPRQNVSSTMTSSSYLQMQIVEPELIPVVICWSGCDASICFFFSFFLSFELQEGSVCPYVARYRYVKTCLTGYAKIKMKLAWVHQFTAHEKYIAPWINWRGIGQKYPK